MYRNEPQKVITSSEINLFMQNQIISWRFVPLIILIYDSTGNRLGPTKKNLQ